MRILAALFVLSVVPFSFAQSTAPFNRYLALAEAGKTDPRVESFARACVTGASKPERSFFYTVQNDWLPVNDLHSAFATYVTGHANTAAVWQYDGIPRVVYLWEVDMEYQRDTLFCLNKAGDVTKSISRFFPSQSGEPRERWTYVRTMRPGQHSNTWQTIGVYEDEHGKRMVDPDLSSEDKDFIKGERVYHYWNDFDFADTLKQQPDAARVTDTTKEGEAIHAAP
jgi:hypothetical protein